MSVSPPSLSLSLSSQGKGLLPTYWVKGTKQYPEQPAAVNLYQSEVQSKWPIQTSPSATPTHISRVASPAEVNRTPPVSVTDAPESNKKPMPGPYQWPQADWTLARRQAETRATIPDLVSQELPSQELVTPPTLSRPRARRSRSTTVELSDRSFRPFQSHRLSEPSPPRNLVASEDISPGLSELNLMNIRTSLSLPIAPLMEGNKLNEHQLAKFVTMAEENARQARCIADWASGLARLSRCTETVDKTGSSVDVCPFHIATSSRQGDTPSPSNRTNTTYKANTVDSSLTREPPTSSGNVQDGPCTIL